jgi:hypothetical protein
MRGRNIDEGVTLDDDPARDSWYREQRVLPKPAQAAVIVRESENGREPYAELEDGRVMPMGWNMGDRVAVGTKGTAEYIKSSYASLWKFTAEQDEHISHPLDTDRDWFGEIGWLPRRTPNE